MLTAHLSISRRAVVLSRWRRGSVPLRSYARPPKIRSLRPSWVTTEKTSSNFHWIPQLEVLGCFSHDITHVTWIVSWESHGMVQSSCHGLGQKSVPLARLLFPQQLEPNRIWVQQVSGMHAQNVGFTATWNLGFCFTVYETTYSDLKMLGNVRFVSESESLFKPAREGWFRYCNLALMARVHLRFPCAAGHAAAFVGNTAQQLKSLTAPTSSWSRAAVPKRFGYRAKFAILSASAGRTILCIENKRFTTRITLDTFVFFYLFSLLANMFAMWFIKLLLLLHNGCRLIIGSTLDPTIRRVSCKYASEILFTTAR